VWYSATKETIHFPFQNVVSLDRTYELPPLTRCQLEVSCSQLPDGEYIIYQTDCMINPVA